MAILRIKDAQRLNQKDREEKLKELRMELVRANVTANKTNAKTKEIKKSIARLLTLKKYSGKEPKKVQEATPKDQEGGKK